MNSFSMSKLKRITIIGSSVALRVKPPSENRVLNLNYGELIERNLNSRNPELICIVNNLGLSRAITADVLRMKDQISRVRSDYIILNIGAVDAPTREIPLWFSDVIFQRNGKYVYPIFNFIYLNLIKRFLRKPLVYLRLKTSWTSRKRFKRDIDEIFRLLHRETCAEIIVLGINRGNDRIESNLPGSLKKYKVYDNILKEASKKWNCNFVDVEDLNSPEHFPDGVHYNIEGHRVISDRICRLMNDNTQKNG